MELGVFKDTWADAKAAFDWLPDGIEVVLIVAVALLLALLVHAVLFKGLRRAFVIRYPSLRPLLSEIAGPTRLRLRSCWRSVSRCRPLRCPHHGARSSRMYCSSRSLC